MNTVRILVGDVRERLRDLPDESVQCVVTSPPYWGLRDYGVEGQIGLEESFDDFLSALVATFEEVRRVLRSDGVAWVNMGDGYAGTGRSGGGEDGKRRGVPNDGGHGAKAVKGKGTWSPPPSGMKIKDLLGQPWALAFALRAAGWYLRADVIWSKPNPMPESCTDRPTKAHEYVFLLSKSSRYFYDADALREQPTTPGLVQGSPGGSMKTRTDRDGASNDLDRSGVYCGVGGRNARTVWTIPTQPMPEAHFATFPESLAEKCIRAGSREGDTVLDPFMGAGTTGLVAVKLGRNAVGTELNPAYAQIAERRIRNEVGLLADVSVEAAANA